MASFLGNNCCEFGQIHQLNQKYILKQILLIRCDLLITYISVD